MRHARADYNQLDHGELGKKIGADEPVFLLRAKDVSAASAVRVWAMKHRQMAEEMFGNDPDALTRANQVAASAERHATLMEAWPDRKLASVPIGALELDDPYVTEGVREEPESTIDPPTDLPSSRQDEEDRGEEPGEG